MNFEHYFEKYASEVRRDFSELQEEFMDLCKSVFDFLPGLKAIIITGWTPYFNDGDPCVHSEDVALIFPDKIYESAYTFDDLKYFGVSVEQKDYKSAFLDYDLDMNEFPDNSHRVFKNILNKLISLEEKEIKNFVEESYSKYDFRQKSITAPDEVRRATKLLVTQKLNTIMHETNYRIAVVLEEDGSLSYGKIDYECGH